MSAESHRHGVAFQSDESDDTDNEEDFVLMEEEVTRQINENAVEDPDVKAFEKGQELVSPAG